MVNLPPMADDRDAATPRALTRDEARARADELNHALPDGADHHWIAHHAGGESWQVVRMSAAGMTFAGDDRDLHAQRGPERDAPVDPRPTITRLIPPYGPN